MTELKQKFKKIVLILGDLALLYLSLFIILIFRYGDKYDSDVFWQHLYPFSVVYFLWIIVFYIIGFYSLDYAVSKYKFYALIIKASLFNTATSVLFFYLAFSSLGISPKTILILDIVAFTIFFIVWRSIYGYFLTTKPFSINIAFLIDSPESKKTINIIERNPHLGYNPITHPQASRGRLKDFITKNNIKLIITSNNTKDDPQLLHELYESLALKIKFINISDFYEQLTGQIPLSMLEKIWFLENLKNLDRPFYDAFKKAADIAISSIGLLVSLPFYPFIILAIKLDSKGPAFIIQKRVGQNNKIFNNIKFRSMLVNDNGKWPEKNDKRITRVGKFLRNTRIDESPQLLNVIKGDVSLVGPRPDIIDLYEKLESEIPYYQIRNIVKPGLTGWAQINQEISPHSIEETKRRLSYDFYYLKNKSLILDIIIILKTIKTLISRTGS